MLRNNEVLAANNLPWPFIFQRVAYDSQIKQRNKITSNYGWIKIGLGTQIAMSAVTVREKKYIFISNDSTMP